MARGILFVESGPISPDVADEYHEWYEGHLRELTAVDGIISARRLAPMSGDGPFVAIYEIEGDDLSDVQARLGEAF